MSSEQSILDRLHALERENRRMKRIGVLVMIMAASLLLMAQAPGKRTVEANEFILRDSKGMVRSKWFMSSEGSELSFLDASAHERIVIDAGDKTPGMVRLLGPPNADSSMSLFGPSDTNWGPVVVLSHAGSTIRLSAWTPSEEPSITIQDKQGYIAKLGHVSLTSHQTGETRETSAASLTFFGKDEKVLWQAP